MQYDLQIENVSLIRRRLVFTLPSDIIQSELDKAFRDLGQRVRLPGFRKGKVPRNVLESRYGAQVRGEISGKLIDRAYKEAMGKLPVAGQPALEDRGELKRGMDFCFTIGVDVRPEIEVTGYRGMEVTYAESVPRDEDMDATVKARLTSRARIEEVAEDRPVQAGDYVLTELELKDGDTLLASEAGTMVNTLNERYYPGCELLLAGLRKGEERSDTVTIAQTSQLEGLRGKTVQARVKVVAIQAMRVPELTEEAAKAMGYDDIAAMRAGIQGELVAQAREAGRNDARVKLLQKLVDLNQVAVPGGMIEEQLEALVEELKVRRAYQGENPNAIRFSDNEMADLRNRARFAARASLILEAVARQESIAVDDADVDRKIDEIASLRGQTAAAIRGYLQKEDAIGVLKSRILEEKVLEWLLDQAVLTSKAPEVVPPVAAQAAAAPAAQEEPVAEPAPEEPVAAAPVEEPAPPVEEPAPAPAAERTWDAKMKKAELLEIAQQRGLSVTTKQTKDQILEALEASLGA